MKRCGAGRWPAAAWRALCAASGLCAALAVQAGTPCPLGTWADVMIGSYHIRPDRHFEDFNPGVGIECNIRPQWAASAGYFRNSLLRPSFYAGAIYAPEPLHWGRLRFGAMGGVISGYNYGRFGVGANRRTGLVLAPSAIVGFGRFGANIIVIPPIAADHLPLTFGLQLKYRFDHLTGTAP